jgi:hypothetical protein
VRNDTWIRQTNAKCILTLFHIARIDPGRHDPDANFTWLRLWLVHLADGENIARSALPFIPCCFHRG